MDLDDAKIEGQQLTVTLSTKLIKQLGTYISPEQLNRFVEKAIADQLAFEQQFAALEQKSDDWWNGKLDAKLSKSEEDLTGWLEDIRQKMG